MGNRQMILGIGFDNITLEDSYAGFVSFLKGSSLKTIYTANPEFILNARKDPGFKNILNSGDMVLPDGIGVIMCSRILRRPIKQRVSGVDLVLKILEDSRTTPLSVFLLGSKEDNCRDAALNISKGYPGVNVLGYQNGYYDISDELALSQKINLLGPDLLLVALGSPRQEKYIEKYKNVLNNVKCAIGVGGTIDILSGNIRLAPDWIRKAGLEWLYRIIKEPVRIKRTIRLPLVLMYAFFERLKKS